MTDRGRPIARLSPLAEETGYQALLDAGRIAPGPGLALDALLAEIDRDLPPDTAPSVSDELARLRSEER